MGAGILINAIRGRSILSCVSRFDPAISRKPRSQLWRGAAQMVRVLFLVLQLSGARPGTLIGTTLPHRAPQGRQLPVQMLRPDIDVGRYPVFPFHPPWSGPDAGTLSTKAWDFFVGQSRLRPWLHGHSKPGRKPLCGEKAPRDRTVPPERLLTCKMMAGWGSGRGAAGQTQSGFV